MEQKQEKEESVKYHPVKKRKGRENGHKAPKKAFAGDQGHIATT